MFAARGPQKDRLAGVRLAVHGELGTGGLGKDAHAGNGGLAAGRRPASHPGGHPQNGPEYSPPETRSHQMLPTEDRPPRERNAYLLSATRVCPSLSVLYGGTGQLPICLGEEF